MAARHPSAASFPLLGERPGTFSWWSLRQEFAPTPIRLRSAVKLGLGATVAMVLAFLFNWPASLAMTVPLLITRPDSRYDLLQALTAALASWVAGAFSYWALGYSQNLPLFILVLGGGLMVLGALTTLPAVGVPIIIGVVNGVAVLPTYFYQPDARGSLFLPFTCELMLGYAVALVVQFAVWPYSPRREWDESLLRIWTDSRQACARWFDGEQAPGRPDGLDHQVKEIIGLSSQRVHPTDPADAGVTIRLAASHQVQEVITLLHDLQRLGRGPIAPTETAAWRRLGEEFDRRFAGLGDSLAGQEPAPGDSGQESGWEDLSLDHQAGEGESSGTELLRRENLRRLPAMLAKCSELFHAVAALPQAESLAGRDQSFNWVPAPKLADLRQLGTARPWQAGVKLALLVLSCLLFWQAFRWPSAVTILATALIVNLPDVGSSARRATTRVAGLLLGMLCAVLCTIFVVRYVETIFGYGLTVFVVLAGCGYLCGSSSRVNYIGFQAAVTFVFTFVGDDRQSVSLEAVRTRFVGLVAGVIIAEIILRSFWPVSKVKEMFKGLADNLALCARSWSGLFQAVSEEFPARREEFTQQYNHGLVGNLTLNESIEFEGGAGSARYGHSSRLLIHENALFEQMQLIGADWMNLAHNGRPLPGEFDAIGRRLAALAEHLGQPVDLPPFPATAEADPTGQDAQQEDVLRQRLQQVESILASMERLTGLPADA